MKQLMEELEKEGDLPDNLSFLSSHPLTKERIKTAHSYIMEHPQKLVERNDLKEIFESIKSAEGSQEFLN